jgi:protein-S-isoprenylcysteine O-methyltransferase Ste14
MPLSTNRSPEAPPGALSLRERLLDAPRSRRTRRILTIVANLVGAGGAALFAVAGWRHFASTHSFVGAGFFAVQLWVVAAYLARRPASVVSQRAGDWLLAFGGTFGGVLLRPTGAHPPWGVTAGGVLQVVGLAICAASFLSLGRSFGFAPADRGVKRRGTYAVVRHPIYASYFLLQAGYLLQSPAVWNALVMLFVTACNVGRAVVEERLLATNPQYGAYRSRVRWRLFPGVW